MIGSWAHERPVIALFAPFGYRHCKDMWYLCDNDHPAIKWGNKAATTLVILCCDNPHHSHRSTHSWPLPRSWWRHQMEAFSALLTLCAGNSPVTGEFPSQRPVTRSCDVFSDLRLNKQLSKQSWGWWFETPSCSLWRHCNVMFNFVYPQECCCRWGQLIDAKHYRELKITDEMIILADNFISGFTKTNHISIYFNICEYWRLLDFLSFHQSDLLPLPCTFLFKLSDICPHILLVELGNIIFRACSWWRHQIEKFSRVTGPLCGEFTGHRWIPRTKASHAELCCFLWSAPE